MSNFKGRVAGNPLLLVASGLLFSATFFLAYKQLYKPYAKRRLYMKQEELMRPLIESRHLKDIETNDDTI